MDWTVTGGDLLQIVGVIGAAWLYVQRMDKRVAVMQAEFKALERRVDGLEQGIKEDLRDIKQSMRTIAEKLDRKADK